MKTDEVETYLGLHGFRGARSNLAKLFLGSHLEGWAEMLTGSPENYQGIDYVLEANYSQWMQIAEQFIIASEILEEDV